MVLESKVDYVLKLDTPELRLILKALGGRLKPEEVSEASALGERIARQRADQNKLLLAQNDKLLNNLA